MVKEDFPQNPGPLLDSVAMGRRGFVKSLAAMVAAVEVGLDTLGAGPMERTAAGAPSKKTLLLPPDPVVGIQMSPHTMLDEGIEQCLDLIQETAAINTVIPYAHAFHTRTLGKPLRDLATDHGKPPRDFRGRVPAVRVRHHEPAFGGTALRVRPTDPALEFADRDLFAELVGPCGDRRPRHRARLAAYSHFQGDSDDPPQNPVPRFNGLRLEPPPACPGHWSR